MKKKKYIDKNVKGKKFHNEQQAGHARKTQRQKYKGLFKTKSDDKFFNMAKQILDRNKGFASV